MSDPIRWCFNHESEQCQHNRYGNRRFCDVREAVVLPADKPIYQLDSIRDVGGHYSSWNCLNCGTDHGGEGCDNPDFGKWHQWYEIEGLVEVGKEVNDE